MREPKLSTGWGLGVLLTHQTGCEVLFLRDPCTIPSRARFVLRVTWGIWPSPSSSTSCCNSELWCAKVVVICVFWHVIVRFVLRKSAEYWVGILELDNFFCKKAEKYVSLSDILSVFIFMSLFLSFSSCSFSWSEKQRRGLSRSKFLNQQFFSPQLRLQLYF